MRDNRGKIFFTYLFLIFLTILVLYPFYYALITSVKSLDEYYLNRLNLPMSIYLGNYVRVLLSSNMLIYIINSIVNVTLGMFFYIIISSAAGLAFGKFRFKGQLILFTFILFFQIFPQMVIAGGLYQLFSKMRLINTRAGILLAWLAYFCPFGTYIMTTFFSTIPKNIIESARIDGTNVIQLLFKVMMPIAKPMIGTIGIIGTLSMWNELPFTMLILQKEKLRTITIGIALLQGEHGLAVPVLTAAVIVSAVIPTIFYIKFQNYIAMDVTAGAIKG